MIFTFQIDEEKLSEVFRKSIREEMASLKQAPAPAQSRTLHSIKDLAEFLHVSMATAQRYKNEDIIPYIQCGRKCIFDTTEVMTAMKKYSDK